MYKDLTKMLTRERIKKKHNFKTGKLNQKSQAYG